MSIVITGTGSHIPGNRVKNSDFLEQEFYDKHGAKIKDSNEITVNKLEKITGIAERRYGDKEQVTSDIATFAAARAIEDAGIDQEELDYIIVGQNFGDVIYGSQQVDQVPSVASRVKYNLKIKDPSCVAYDLVFGCPGWLEGLIHTRAFIKAGMAKKCLVIGAEMLSRVLDQHDRDSMIFADGAGAAVVEEKEGPGGIINHTSTSYTYTETPYLTYGCSYKEEKEKNYVRYIKMQGRRIYNFSLSNVPQAMKACLDKSEVGIADIDKIFVHQANEKMDIAIAKRFYKLFDKPVPDHIMPMNIHKLGNTSVGTLPTLFDMVRRGQIENHRVNKGDTVIFASVGAGMNINALVYKV